MEFPIYDLRFAISNFDELVKSIVSPLLAGGDEGEGDHNLLINQFMGLRVIEWVNITTLCTPL
jgi:hypothetical protein